MITSITCSIVFILFLSIVDQRKKKQRLEVQESIQNNVSENQVGSSHQDSGNARKETHDKQGNLSNVKKKKEGGGGEKKNVESNDTDMDTPPNLKEYVTHKTVFFCFLCCFIF